MRRSVPASSRWTVQHRQQLRREHHVAVLPPLAVGDAQHHALRVDGGYGEPDGLGDAQAGGVAGGQDGAMLDGLDRVEKPGHFFAAGHDRQGPGPLRQRDQVVEAPPLVERGPVEKAERRHVDDQSAPSETSFVGQVDLVGADLLRTQAGRGATEVPSEPRDGADVHPLGGRRQPSHLHVFEHASTERCHKVLLCEGAWGIPGVRRAAYGGAQDTVQRSDDRVERLSGGGRLSVYRRGG